MSSHPTKKRKQNTRQSTISCAECEEDIPRDAKYAELSPCGCVVCLVCLLDLHAKRGVSLLSCCEQQVTSHQIYNNRLIDGDSVIYELEKKTIDDVTIKKNHPLVHLKKEKLDILKNTPLEDSAQISVLYFASLMKKPDTTKVSATFSVTTLSQVGSNKVSLEDCDGLCRFFAIVKTIIIPSSITPRIDIPTMMPRRLFDYGVNNFTPLMALLYGLATGQPTRALDKISNPEMYQDYQSQYLAIIAAADMILRCTTQYPNHFQLMLGAQLEMQKVSTKFRDMLTAFRIASSFKTSYKHICQEIVARLMKGVSVGPYDWPFCNGDNVGFKKLGDEASYEQFTAFQDIIVRQQRLEEIGIHVTNDRSTQLSREPEHNWTTLVDTAMGAEIGEDELAEEIGTVNNSDVDTLTHSVMEGIQVAIDLHVGGMIKAGQYVPRVGYIINHDTRLALAQRQIAVGTDVLEEQEGEIDAEDGDNNGSSNNNNNTADIIDRHIPESLTGPSSSTTTTNEPINAFYGHDITVNCIKNDLAKTMTVCMILEYVNNTRRMVLEKFYKEYEEKNGVPPPADIGISELPPASLGAIFMCDGQPAAKIASIIAADNRKFYLNKDDGNFPDEHFPDDDSGKVKTDFDKWFIAINSQYGFLGKAHSKGGKSSRFCGKTYAFPGAFHSCLKLHNCCGLMFSNFLSHFFAAWRDTPNKVKWILYPSDPRQLESELPYYIQAHYRSAFVWLWEYKGGPATATRPSASEVHRYMLKRANDCPLRQAVLIHLRYGEVSKMMRMSYKLGKRGCVKTFLTAVRFGLTLWATAHATDYVRLGLDLLQFMHCASPAMKKIYAEEIFTRLDAKGNPIASDLGMELTVKDIRKDCGKVYTRNHDLKVTAACNQIPCRPTQDGIQQKLRKGSIASRPSRSKGEEKLLDKSPLIKGYNQIHNEMKLWHPKDQPIIGGTADKPIYAKPNSYDLPKGESLNEQVLHIFSIGTERVKQYFFEYYIKNPFSVNRSEKKVPLTRILATSMEMQLERKKAIDRAVSIKKEELGKLTREILAEEISRTEKALFLALGGHNIVFIDPKQLDKPNLIKALIKIRKQYFEKDTTAKDKLEREAERVFNEKYPNKATNARVAELEKSPIYQLSSTVCDMERYKIV